MNRTVNATTPLGAELKFKSLKGYETLSGLFEWTIAFVAESHRLDLQAMLGKPVSLEVETTGAPRYLHGLVTAFRLVHRETATPRHYIYEATVRPWLWYATQTSNSRIFQEQTAAGMITRILQEYGYAVDNRLIGSYRQWGYCVQFQETDFNFISRLMEHEGIYYWFRHEKTRHVLVLMDDAHSHEALNGMSEIPFYPDDRLTAPQQECISDWQTAGELTPTTYSTMDYDFQKPQADMSAKRWIKRQNTQGLDLEWYDPMGGYVDSAESEHYARVHLESLQCLQEQAWASGNVRNLAPGYTFSLKHYPNRAENKAYLIVRAEYDIGVQSYASTDQPTNRAHFAIRSQQIPATVQFRASRVTPVPKMSGPQTATVVGPEGEEIWTDKYGRIKVQFHWDRQGKMNEDSSCWVRVSNPWAGGGFGGVQIPRVREEVVVDFINGDVDRPIAVGRVYNASNMPPVNLPDDATQSGFLTRSKNGTPENANKLMFEDRQGSELLSMVAEKNMNTHVKNNQSHDVVGNVVSGIAGLRSHTAHSTSDITMSSGAIKSYLADHNRTVQTSLEDSIGGNLAQILSDGVDETITGSFDHTVGGPASHEVLGLHVDTTAQDDETVDGTVDETVGAEEITNVTADSELEAADIQLDSPTLYKESTQQDIDIKAGGALDIESTGPGILQTPTNITKESPANLEMAVMLDNNTVNRQENYILKLNLDLLKDVMVEGGKTDMNVADLAFYGMGGTMQAANIGVYGANIQLGATDQKAGLANLSITGLELDKGFKIKTMGAGGRSGYKGKHRKSGGGRGPKGPNGGKHRAGDKGGAKKPHADCKECIGRTGLSIGFDVGDERFSHTDFYLPGTFPITWNRVYRSNMDTKDISGELGPRWITPFTLSILAVEDGSYEYVSDLGRMVSGKSLAIGESWYDRTEELRWARPSDEILTINHKQQRIEYFEYAGSSYRLKKIEDRCGNAAYLSYDQNTNLLISIATNLYTLSFKHDEAGRIVQIGEQSTLADEPTRILALYVYSEHGDLVMATDSYGRHYQYQYDNHLITRYSDRTGRGVNLEWEGTDPNAKCVREYLDDGTHETRLRWDPLGSRTFVTDALGYTTTYVFDEFNYIAAIEFPDGTKQIRKRDEFHNIVEVVYPDGSSERYDYDKFDNVIRSVRADGSEVKWEYDQRSQITRIVDPSGNTWERGYDDHCNMIREIDPKGLVTLYQYTLEGNLSYSTNALGGTSRLTYNSMGLLSSYTDCSNKTRRWEYDAYGRTLKETGPEGEAVSYAYDQYGFIAEAIQADGSVISIEYDEEGRILSVVDPVDNLTRYEYDQGGRLTRKIDPLKQSFRYGYDRKGRLAFLKNENGDLYRFQFDPVDRLVQTTGFDGKIRKYNYNKETGLLTSMEDAGLTTRFEYDVLGQLLERRSGDLVDQFEYDIANRIVRAQNEVCEQVFAYDEVGNPINEIHRYSAFGETRTYQWQNTFDELYNRSSCIRPDGMAVDWLRYGSGHVHGILLNKKEVLSFERDGNHREIQRRQANALIEVTQYEPTGRVKSQKLSLAGGSRSAIFQRSYAYRKDGALASIADSRCGDITYKYDPLDRLSSVTAFDYTELFDFDPAGNLTDIERSPEKSKVNSFPKDVSRVLGNLLRRCAGMHFHYDEHGNLIRKEKPGEVQDLDWDAFGRLAGTRSVKTGSEAGTSRLQFAYDPFGRRIAKSANSSNRPDKVVFYGWDGNHLAFEHSVGEAPAAATHYLFDEHGFTPLFQYRHAADSFRSAGTGKGVEDAEGVLLNYYHCDHLGTPQLLTDNAGDIVWEGRYTAFGKQEIKLRAVSHHEHATENNLCFQGQYLDRESGFHYNRFRYYDPDTGRFIQQDPIGLMGGANFYQYAPNSINWIDPWGLMKGILRSTWNAIRNNYYKGLGGEVNHAPAYASYKGLSGAPSRGRGPAYWMERADHRAMASTGSGRDAKIFRAMQREHIMNSRWDRAIAMDLEDLNDKYPGKYNEDFRHLLDEHERQGNITKEQRQSLSDRLKDAPKPC